MGASDILKNNINDLDEARIDRNNRQNPPEHAPGQDSIFDDDLFSSNFSQPTGDSLDLGLGSNSLLDNDILGDGGIFNSVQQTQPQEPQKSDEDKLFEFLGNICKGIWGFVKDIIESFKEVTPKFWTSFGSTCVYTSLVMGVLGVVLRLFGIHYGTVIVLSAFFIAIVGVPTLMFLVDKSKNYTSKYKEDNNSQNTDSIQSLDSSDNLDLFEDNDDIDDFSFSLDDDDEKEGNDVDFFNSDDDLFSSINLNNDMSSSEEPLSTNEALDSLSDIPAGMYTRQYLYDAFTKVLPCITKDFNKVKEIDDNSDIFICWETYLRDACEITGVKEDCLPDLKKLEESLFIIKLTFTRVTGLKQDAVANEIARIYAFKDGRLNEKVFGKADVIGKTCIITIFTGETAMISLKDTYSTCKDFMLDSNNYMPIVVGVDQLGNIILADFKEIESILVTGMPGSGKSWFVKSILDQMCAFVSPSELSIYICDPKGKTSDFKTFRVPHVKKFVSDDNEIVSTLRNLVKDEANRREQIIGDAGCVNIWDFKKKCPDVHLPIIYVLIDEVVTLAERMEKETKQEFQSLLVELISRLRSFGIRAFMIPHVIKNDIIAKTATDLITCRISICGDAGHIESTTGAKPKDFRYKLVNKGDMAVRMPIVSGETIFVHAPVITPSNPENDKIIDYLRLVWKRLEPEEYKNSLAPSMDEECALDELLAESNNTDDFDISDDFIDSDYFENSSSNSNTLSSRKSLFDNSNFTDLS